MAAILTVAIVAGPTDAESGVATLSAGQESVIANMMLNTGDAVEWSYSSGLSTKFIVNREGTGEVYSTAAMVGHGTFIAPAAGQYTFAFKNTGDNLTIVSYDVQRKVDLLPLIAVAGVGAAALGGTGAFLWYRKRRRVVGGTPATPAEVPPPPPPW